jgi:probable addiction module antidote protein
MKARRSYHEDLIEDLKDTKEAQAYLNAALEEGGGKSFLLALKNVLEAQGGLSKFSRHAKLNRVSLYKMLSRRGNPEWGSIISLLNALRVRF